MLLSRSEHTVAVAAVLGALAILSGAFGGHGLRTILSPQDLQTYQTAVQYHMISTLALLGVGILQGSVAAKSLARESCYRSATWVPPV